MQTVLKQAVFYLDATIVLHVWLLFTRQIRDAVITLFDLNLLHYRSCFFRWSWLNPLLTVHATSLVCFPFYYSATVEFALIGRLKGMRKKSV